MFVLHLYTLGIQLVNKGCAQLNVVTYVALSQCPKYYLGFENIFII